jgi:hypothetical protein
MKVAALIIAILLLCGCSHKANEQPERAPAQLSKWSWLPSSEAHAAEVGRIPQGAKYSLYIPEETPLKTHSEAPGGIDSYLNFVPTVKKSLVVDGGTLVSELGPVRKTAKWGDWAEVWKDSSRSVRVGWGYCVTSGEIMLPRSVFEAPPPDKFVQNAFEIEPFGDGNVLIRLDPAKGHRLCFFEGDNGKLATAGWVGSKAEVSGKVLERRADGWYSGALRMSN